jgi:hypothetical protein
MNEMHQLASAMLVIVFAAVMLILAQLYIENRSMKFSILPPGRSRKRQPCRLDKSSGSASVRRKNRGAGYGWSTDAGL